MKMKPATTPTDLAQRIRTVRRDLYLSQDELAAKIGVTNITVSRWERGVTTPDTRSRRTLAELSDRTPEYFKLATPALAKLQSEPGIA